MAYDVRESYLQRQSVGAPAETTYLSTGEFQTKTCNVWRSEDQEIYPANQLDLYDGTSFGDRYDFTNRHMNSLFCPAANLISNQTGSEDSLMKAATGDVVLEQDLEGNSYLHLILPADRINFLHGAQG